MALPKIHDKTKRTAAWTVIGLIGLMAIGLIIMNLTGFGEEEPADQAQSPASATAAPSTPSDSSGVSNASTPTTCDVPDDGSTVTNLRVPEDVGQSSSDLGLVYPFSDAVGPTESKDGVGYCFAHSPVGAAFAASNVVGIYDDSRFTPDQRGILLDDIDRADSEPAADPDDPRSSEQKIVGFTVESYTDEKATIGLVTQVTPNGQTESVLAKSTGTLVWAAGDWKLAKNSFSEEATEVAPGDFTLFEGGK
ncbi:hypothetical protein NBM05_03830 [Rothia sp. AR01]|uniref:DUF8175 domain-containing protein n=1 Tax=Rothia santali TaxID=2949643 RepID=A0A9X2HHW5_9MICC|nr:hypothetical protein [Rothia santali]MCP3425178.1 hypothetical protein [Rothia santali]